MVDLREEHEWLNDWVKADLDGLGSNINTRKFDAFEVELIMKIYSESLLTVLKTDLIEFCEDKIKHDVNSHRGAYKSVIYKIIKT